MLRFPIQDVINESREMTTYFQGYNHNLNCPEGAFFETENITTDEYPILATRKKRSNADKGAYDAILGIIGSDEGTFMVASKNSVISLYKDFTRLVTSGITFTNEKKHIEKMGAYIVIMPDKVWYNTEDNTCGYMGTSFARTASVAFTLCGSDGSNITYHDSAYYESHTPNDGDYMMTTSAGVTSLKVFSKVTQLWSIVTTTYIKIALSGIGNGLYKGDGVKVSVNLAGISWDAAKSVFVNQDEHNANIWYSNFALSDVASDYIIIPGLLRENKTLSIPITVAREVPTMSFMTQCNNRLWGCSEDGHEIYCCKLGDVKNWNYFAGIATDSWAATVGTDGEFTGAFTYLGYPIFFKENSLIRVIPSATGAHQTKDMQCRGVQKGSEKSLVMINELLYYKAGDSVCVYDGQFPQTISDALGAVIYSKAVGGSINNKYYISMMESSSGKYSLFVYDTTLKTWCREDATKVDFFYTDKGEGSNELNNALFFVNGNEFHECNLPDGKDFADEEDDFDWMVQTNAIGYAVADKKQIGRINVRMSMDADSYVGFYIQYDSEGPWHNVWQMYDVGTKTFTIPMTPRRCDHYRFRLKGHGRAKIYSITKSYTEGSDM